MSLLIKHFYRFGEFTVDTGQKVLLRDGRPVPMTPKVFDMLLVLVENNGRIVEKEELMNRLWPDSFVEEANLTSNIQQLRKSLGDNARRPIYIETVARRGYRFIAKVVTEEQPRSMEAEDTVAGANSAGARASGAAQSGAGQARGVAADALVRLLTRRWPAFLGIAIVLIAGLGAWLLWSRSARSQPSIVRPMVAVLPFKNLTGDESQDYFSDGLTEEMITQLGNLDPDRFGMIACTSVMHYKNSQASLDQIGRELGVQYLLEGSVRRDADKVRITAQLIQMKDQTHLWAREYDRELSHLLALQSEIAQRVAVEIQLTLGGPRQSDLAPRTSSPPETYEAYDLYLKGQYFFNKRTTQGLPRAIDYFQQAAAKDPSYARAYAALADSYAILTGYTLAPQSEFLPKARAAALRALELDESLPEAHTALALIVQNYDWDWRTAEKEYRRAIELNPNYATAHHWYAESLTWQGRFDEALRESERARQLDPLSLIVAADNGAILYYSRQYDRAIEKFRSVLDMEPNFPRAHLQMYAFIQEGRFAEALADLDKYRSVADGAGIFAVQAYVYGRAGQVAAAHQALLKLEEANRREPMDPPSLFTAYIGVGDKDRALLWLEKAYMQHSNGLTQLKVDPIFDPLRSDPRFQELVRRVGLG